MLWAFRVEAILCWTRFQWLLYSSLYPRLFHRGCTELASLFELMYSRIFAFGSSKCSWLVHVLIISGCFLQQIPITIKGPSDQNRVCTFLCLEMFQKKLSSHFVSSNQIWAKQIHTVEQSPILVLYIFFLRSCIIFTCLPWAILIFPTCLQLTINTIKKSTQIKLVQTWLAAWRSARRHRISSSRASTMMTSTPVTENTSK